MGPSRLGSVVLERHDAGRLRQARDLCRLLERHRQPEQRARLAGRAQLVGTAGRLERALGRAHRDRVQRLVELVDAGEVHLDELDRADLLRVERREHLDGGAEGTDLVAHGAYPTAMVALPSELTQPAERVGARLRDRGETVAVAEGSAGGLVSASLLSVPGASAYYVGGAVVYTLAASRAWMAGAVEVPEGMRGATEDFAHVPRALDRGEARHDVGDR